jgi:hypothetical protein
LHRTTWQSSFTAIRDLEDPMPTLETPRDAIPRRWEMAISTAQRGWQQSAVRAMRNRQPFVLETDCPSFDPSDGSVAALLPWLRGTTTGVVSCHTPASIGLVCLGSAALCPEPITRTVMAVAGLIGLGAIGNVVGHLLISRYTYRWRVAFNPDRRKYTWLAEPIG